MTEQPEQRTLDQSFEVSKARAEVRRMQRVVDRAWAKFDAAYEADPYTKYPTAQLFGAVSAYTASLERLVKLLDEEQRS